MKDMEGISEKIASIREALDELEELVGGEDSEEDEPEEKPLKKNVKDSKGKKKVHMMLAFIGKKR